jgi:hypothetical protein
MAMCTFLLVAASASFAGRLGADFSKEELASKSFAGITPVHGYWVNWMDNFYFQGTADKLNLFLAAIEARKEAVVKIVLHTGTTKARSPWDKSENRPAADWSLFTVNGITPASGTTNAQLQKLSPPTQVDIWTGGKVELGKLKVPEKFELTASKETDKQIDKFIAGRKKPTS